jgi:2-dehydro-3-deoxyphosphogluconate aldolase/(4S)-4-hydroxy-2-oxoglutarate aldolase
MELLDALVATRVVAILRTPHSSRLAPVADTLADEGFSIIEFALSAPGTLEALRDFAASGGSSVLLGAGTVLDREAAKRAVAAGATYLVTPAVCLDVIDEAGKLGVPVLPGAYTPTEVLQAWQAGACAVKLFPASSGGRNHLRAVRAPLPDIPLVPTGGVTTEQVPGYLSAGALAVGIGSPLIGDACDGGDLGQLRERARALHDIVASSRQAA